MWGKVTKRGWTQPTKFFGSSKITAIPIIDMPGSGEEVLPGPEGGSPEQRQSVHHPEISGDGGVHHEARDNFGASGHTDSISSGNVNI